MARPLRIEFPGAYYHITSRGNGKQDIFLSEGDRTAFLEQLATVIELCNWGCHAYCLMNSHYHLLVNTPDGNLSKGMQQLNAIYSQAFNKANKRVGHVMQGRYFARLIDWDGYLTHVARYIVLNPVHDGFVGHPSQWRWSSYAATVGLSTRPYFLRVTELLGVFSEFQAEARRQYAEFVEDGINEEDLPHEAYLDRGAKASKLPTAIEVVLKKKRYDSEYTLEERFANRRELSEIIDNDRDMKERDERILEAYAENGYSMSEIGAFLGLHHSTISKIIKRVKVKGSNLEL